VSRERWAGVHDSNSVPPPSRLQNPEGLGEQKLRVAGVLEHLDAQRALEGVRGKRHRTAIVERDFPAPTSTIEPGGSAAMAGRKNVAMVCSCRSRRHRSQNPSGAAAGDLTETG